jgi:hypothetical protein
MQGDLLNSSAGSAYAENSHVVYIYVCVCACMYVCMYVCIYVYACKILKSLKTTLDICDRNHLRNVGFIASRSTG